MNFEKYYLLDTNIILEDASNLLKLSENGKNLIILAETVLDELDSKKSGYDEINFQAREFARMLDGAIFSSTKILNDSKIIRFKLNDKITIDTISKTKYLTSDRNTPLNIYNDRKILEIAQFANDYYQKEVVFLSLDIMARIRAISLDIKASLLKGSLNEDFSFDFIRKIEIDFAKLDLLDKSLIQNFDKDYKSYYYSYCFKVKDSDQVILACIQNSKIKVLDEEEIREQIITPLNKEQLFFSNALQEQYYDVLIVEALAGSGKTLLALSGAIKLIRNKKYQKIIYIRNSIESLDKGEDVGYLPGLEEKFKIYNHPLMDSLRYIIRSEHKRKRKSSKQIYEELGESEISQRVELMIKNYFIETMWVGEMRGRTLSSAFIIIDEAQNMSNKTMQMVLSRIDASCKVVILGSNKQIDNFYVNKYTNSLTSLLKSCKQESSIINTFAISLRKVLRGPITQWAEEVFSLK